MNGKSILIVSEGRARAVARALAKILAAHGRTRVVSGAGAARELRAAPYDLVVIDDGTMARAMSLLSGIRRQLFPAAVLVIKDDVTWEDSRNLLLGGAGDVITEPPITAAGAAHLDSSVRRFLRL